MRAADAAIGEKSRAVREIQAAIDAQELALGELVEEATALDHHLDVQRATLAALLRSAYAIGRQAELKLLLAQDRERDAARARVYHRYVQAGRAQRVAALLGELDRLEALRDELELGRARLSLTRDAQQAQLGALEAQRSERAELVASIEARHRAGAERIAALGRDEQALVRLLEELRDVLADVPRRLEQAEPLQARRGALPWPLAGALRVGFGGRLPDGRPAAGWLIDGRPGAEVRAISHGRVAFADWLKGYGLIVIVDHGEGWMSLYANNDALLKDVGDWVDRGEPVSTVGSSGAQPVAALYFELRRDSRPVDPAQWLQAR